MAETILCLDRSVWVKFLVAEEPAGATELATSLVLRGLTEGRFVAPAFAWTEVGSVLRKKLRQGLLSPDVAAALWSRFGDLPMAFLDSPALRQRAWAIAERHRLPTLDDAAFLACVELAPPPSARREFWTADEELLHALGDDAPEYVRRLAASGGDPRLPAQEMSDPT